MKRTLSLLVALAMVICMVPNVFAADDSVDFDDLIYLENYSPLTVNIEEGAAEPVEFLWVPTEDGTLSYDINNADTTVSIVLTQGENTATSEAGLVKLDVVAGEEVSIKISDTTGAAVENLVINGTFGKECKHDPDEPVEEDRVEATCTADGSYNSVVYCSLCGEKLSSTPVAIPMTEHPWDEGTYVEATTSANAYTHYECTVCDATKDVEEPGTQLPETKFEITTQPTDQHVKLNDNAVFTVVATGAVSYKWQRLKPGATKYTDCTLTGYDTPTLTVKANTSNQMIYRCVLTDDDGNKLYTDDVTFTTYLPEPATNITSQDGDKVVQINKEVSFSVTVENPDMIVSYRWQKRNPAGTYWNYTGITGYNTDTITMQATKYERKYFRCEMRDINGVKIYSDEVTYSFAESPIKLEIIDYTPKPYAISGQKVTLSVVAQGSNLTYQWERSKDGGVTWGKTAVGGDTSTTANMTFTINYEDYNRSGYQYRCVVKDDYGGKVYSKSILPYRLKCELEVTVQPTVTVDDTNTATMTFTADGETLTYLWQRLKGDTWSNASGNNYVGYNTNTLTTAVAGTYRCRVTDAAGNVVFTDNVVFAG